MKIGGKKCWTEKLKNLKGSISNETQLYQTGPIISIVQAFFHQNAVSHEKLHKKIDHVLQQIQLNVILNELSKFLIKNHYEKERAL